VAKLNCLVGIHQTTHTVFDTEDIVVDGVYILIEVFVIGNESCRIESTKVEGPSWLELSCIETKWNS